MDESSWIVAGSHRARPGQVSRMRWSNGGWTRRFEAPLRRFSASSDPTIVERGRYLVFGPAACAYCHVPREQWGVLDAVGAPVQPKEPG